MSALSDARAAVAARFAEFSATVSESVPEMISPPCAFLVPGEPYVTANFQGMNFGESLLNLGLILAVERGGNDVQADGLDDLIVEAVALVENDATLFLDDVSRPEGVVLNGQRFLGTIVNFSTIVRLRD